MLRVKDSSAFLKIELERASYELGYRYFTNVRGYGTLLGFDTKDARTNRNL